MNRLIEFVEDANGKLSAGRLFAMLSFIPATYVVVKEAENGTLTDTRFLIFCSTYAAAFVAGKALDYLKGRQDAAQS